MNLMIKKIFIIFLLLKGFLDINKHSLEEIRFYDQTSLNTNSKIKLFFPHFFVLTPTKLLFNKSNSFNKNILKPL